MKKVLHYKTNFLNKSETFIDRLIRNHRRYRPVALCYRKRSFSDNLPVFEAPKTGIDSWINFAAFHSNLPLPYYSEVLNREKPDLIHAHFGYDGVKLIKIAKKHDIPLLVSFYGTDVSRLPSEFLWKYRYSKLASGATHFVAASSYMKKQLIRLGFPEHKISMVRFGIELNGSTVNGEFPSEHKVMMVGRMVQKKGFQYGIRAIYHLRKKGYKPEVNIYGYGPEMESLKKLSSDLEVDDQITFHGYQPIEKIFAAHHQHTLMLAPSVIADDGDMEGLPNTIIEAMAEGTPVIGTRHAAIPELINNAETGFLVDEKDVNALAETMEKVLIGNFDLQKIRKKAREEIECKYSIQRMVQEVESIYDQITS